MMNTNEKPTIMRIQDDGDGDIRVFVDIARAIHCAVDTENGLDTDPGFWGVVLAYAAHHAAKAHHIFLGTLHERGHIEKLPTKERVLERVAEVLCDELQVVCSGEGAKIRGAVALRKLEAEFDEDEDGGDKGYDA
jgi:hypothetical protein